MNTLTRLAVIAGLLLVLTVALPVWGQEAVAAEALAGNTLTDVLLGKAFPLTLKLKDLDAEWRSFSPAAQGDASSSLMTFFMAMAASESHKPMDSAAFYTKGQTVTLGTETYLVAYSRQSQSFASLMTAMAQHNGNPTDVQLPKVTPENEVTLCMLNVRTMGNLLNIHPFELKNEITQGDDDGKPTETPARIKALQSTSLSQVRQLAVAIQMYVQDNNGKYPPLNSKRLMKDALKAYLGNAEQMFLTPGTQVQYQGNANLAGAKESDIKNPTEVVSVFEPTPWPDGMRVVGFVDGHAKLVGAEEWATLQAKMKVK